MEAHLTAAGEDFLIDGLSFKPPSNTAAYVQETRQVSYFPESGNRFDPVSSRVIRFRLADHAFLEASSCKLGFTITNLGNQNITPLAQPMSMFRRGRLFAASQLVEDRMELATEAAVTDRLLEPYRRLGNSNEAHPLGNPFNGDYQVLGATKSRRILVNLPFGVFQQPKWIPLHLVAGGLILEFELDDALTGFSETSGVDFQITDVKMLANIHTVDSALANSYASHVLRGNPLHLHYNTVVSSRHLVTDSSFDISLVRCFTRLKAIFAVSSRRVKRRQQSLQVHSTQLQIPTLTHTTGKSPLEAEDSQKELQLVWPKITNTSDRRPAHFMARAVTASCRIGTVLICTSWDATSKRCRIKPHIRAYPPRMGRSCSSRSRIRASRPEMRALYSRFTTL